MKRVLFFVVSMAMICLGATLWWLGPSMLQQFVAPLPPMMLQKLFKPLPSKNNINVPFSSQAPLGDWAEPWQNACEETSIVMVDNFYTGNQPTDDEAAEEILRVINLKEQRFGSSKDENIQQIADLINAIGVTWSARVVADPTITQIKAELAASRPVIVPVFAPDLHNPNYINIATLDYHVIVLSGYDDATKEFIAQDPGTSQGKDFRYPYAVILNAIHDDLPDNYQAGRKAVIFTAKRADSGGLSPI